MILKEIRLRRSIRNYKKDIVPDELIAELIKAAQFAPNSHHNRSWEFMIIKNADTKNTLYDLLGQGYLKAAPVLILPLIDTTRSLRPVQDLSLASGNIFIQATSVGLGTVWKNIPDGKRAEIKRLLKIPEDFLFINIIPVGYPNTIRKPHIDNDFDIKKIHFEKW